MALQTSTISLLASNILIPIAILIFAGGFFPYKPFLSGLAQYESLDFEPPPEAPFNKVVFMVVDALRSDFVYSGLSGFQFTQSLIASGAAIPFTAHATSPTITMPRIKALTTGSIPSFLDMILNFAESDTSSTLGTQDTWLAQMKAKETGKLVMYGDDTWLKLLSETFDRADGTSSFFVSDFTEVDNNVTRHVPEELKHTDWNTMVLHYLGLDHIGHKTGPRGPNMISKQREMDTIVRQIYNAFKKEPALNSALLVLCGDHGMNDAGNHGGSTAGETSPALVFISPKFKSITPGFEAPAPFKDDYQYYTTVEQSDIVPTLAALLGFPVPRNNLGAFIVDFLPFWPQQNDKIQILLRNARQVLSVVTATFPSFGIEGPSQNCQEMPNNVDELSCQWRGINERLIQVKMGDQRSDDLLRSISKWLERAQELMSSTASNYDMSKLVAGQALAVSALVLGSISAWRTVTMFFQNSSPLLLISLLYGVMMFASSYVEEEQHFWYWTIGAWLGMMWLKRYRNTTSRLLSITSISILVAVRIVQRWNQTGQKRAGEPDISRTFFLNHKLTLWALICVTYLWNLQSLASRGFPRFSQLIAGAIATALATAAITFKLAFTSEDSPELMAGLAKSMSNNELGVSLVLRARIVFIGIALALIYTIATGFARPRRWESTMRTIHDLLVLFLVTQSRATNIPLLLIFEVLFYLINDLDLTLIELTITSLLFQYMSFFAFGGSNAISSVDLSSAYNGVSDYDVLAVGILTFVSNWTGPIFWTSATNIMLLRLRKQGKKDLLPQHLALLTVFVTSSLVFVMAACTFLRTHLFIWTVFSPKYLYSMAWSLGQHLCINMGFGSLLYWLGTAYF